MEVAESNILKKFAKYFYKYTHEYDYEVCANVLYDDKRGYYLDNILKGTTVEYREGDVIKTRKSCSLPVYKSIIFHSHPLSSRSYPSAEDILKVIKNYGKINTSIIGTLWGIWVISNTSSSNGYTENSKEVWLNCLNRQIAIIGKYTTNRNYKQGESKSMKLDEKTKYIVDRVISDIEKMSKLSIKLYSWNEV